MVVVVVTDLGPFLMFFVLVMIHFYFFSPLCNFFYYHLYSSQLNIFFTIYFLWFSYFFQSLIHWIRIFQFCFSCLLLGLWSIMYVDYKLLMEASNYSVELQALIDVSQQSLHHLLFFFSSVIHAKSDYDTRNQFINNALHIFLRIMNRKGITICWVPGYVWFFGKRGSR